MSTPTVSLNDGTKAPAIAYGTGTALFKQDCTDSVKLAIDCGFTHLDGAQVYGNEESLGAGIKAAGKPRSELYVVTKLNSSTGAADVKASLIESLQKLGMDFVDLFLIHVPPRPIEPEGGPLPELWKAMEAVHAEGLAKSIGVSNFTVEDLKILLPTAKVIPSVNQLELHPYLWKVAEPIVKYGFENGGIIPESYGGLTPLTRAPGGPIDDVLPPIASRLGDALGKPVTHAQILTKWLRQKGAIVVTTSSKADRIKEYLATADVPDLTAEEMQAIDDAGAKLHKRVFARAVFGEES